MEPSPQTLVDHESVLAWMEEHGRALPWRSSRDPWEILVAELMLQQTQVTRVLDRWPRFLQRFPDVTTCAQAPVGEVITEWAGLGYNRRAVNLHRTACIVVDEHDGCFPWSRTELLALPGIGPYTARAVRVFAGEFDDAVLDTNVARILARLAGRPLGRSEAQRHADEMVPVGHGWAWNQALLDIGSGHCKARIPICDGCPFAPVCVWYVEGNREPDPAVGSAAVSGPQARFDGSDRQGRGRLVDALRSGPVPLASLPEVMGWPDDGERAERIAKRVVADGLAAFDGEQMTLP